MRSQMPMYGVGRLASIPTLSFAVNSPNTIKATTIATEKIRNLFPNAAAPKPIISNIKTRCTNVQAIWSVSVSVPPPAAMISRWCIGGQKNPKTASKRITTATNLSFLLSFADNQTPNPKAIRRRE